MLRLTKSKLPKKTKRLIRVAVAIGAKLSRVPFGLLRLIPLARSAYLFSQAIQALGSSTKNDKLGTSSHGNCLFVSPGDIDWIIVGSGPGGAAFAKLSKGEGHRVLVIEAGQELDTSIRPHSFDQLARDFAHGGYDLILSSKIIPFAEGATWGGGSEVNSGLFHTLPKSVVRKWASIIGIEERALTEAIPEIESELRVTTQSLQPESPYSRSPLVRMGEELGWTGGIVPRWRTYSASDYVHHGASSTYLGSLIPSEKLIKHKVSRIKVMADHVQVFVEGEGCSHVLSSGQVCLSAGAVSTPEILIKSKLARAQDFAFSFHAMIREVALFNKKVNDLSDIDPHQFWSPSHEFKIGAAVGTPDLLSAVMTSKGVVEQPPLENVASFYISIPSHGKSGLIRLLGDLYPFFFPSKEFKERSIYAQHLLARAIEKSGGKILGQGGLSLSTVHIFGSLPLGSTTILDNLGRLVAHPNRVLVRDSSILPTHPLVNPQGPLLQLVHALHFNRGRRL